MLASATERNRLVCAVSGTAPRRTLIVAIAPTIEQTRRRADAQTRALRPVAKLIGVPLTTVKRRPLLQQGRGLVRDGLPDEASADISMDGRDATVPADRDGRLDLLERRALVPRPLAVGSDSADGLL